MNITPRCGPQAQLVKNGSHTSWKVLDFFLENSRAWKVLEKHFSPGKSWKLKLKVLESPVKISLKITHFLLVLMENKQK